MNKQPIFSLTGRGLGRCTVLLRLAEYGWLVGGWQRPIAPGLLLSNVAIRTEHGVSLQPVRGLVQLPGGESVIQVLKY